MDTFRTSSSSSSRRPLPSPPPKSSTAPGRPPLGPRLVSEERRPSAFNVSEESARAPAEGRGQSPLHRNQSQRGTRAEPHRSGNGGGGAGTRVEADFTTTFPPSQHPPPPSLIHSRSHEHRVLQTQFSFAHGPPSSRSAGSNSQIDGTPPHHLARSSSLTSAASPSATAGPSSRQGSTSASVPVPAPTPSPNPPRSRQPSATSSSHLPAPTPSATPAPAPRLPSATASAPSTSTSGRRTEPTLPSAPVSAPAPPTGMYWSRTPISGRVPRGMRAHSAVLVSTASARGERRRRTAQSEGNEVWVFGGCDIRGACFKDMWKLDCDTFIWTKPKVTGEIPPVTRAHTCTAVDQRLFIFGGGDGPHYYNDTYIFDTLSNTWSKPLISGTAPSRRRAHAAIYQPSHGRILIFGGGNGANALNDLHALDVSALDTPVSQGGGGMSWRRLETRGRRPVARGYHSMDLVGTKAIVFGGSDGTECFSDVWVLDLETLTWHEISSPSPSSPSPTLDYVAESFPRLSHTSTTVGSYLFIVGGHDGVSFSSEVLLYNLVTHSFEPRTTYGLPPSPRGYHATILHDSRLLIFGGFNGNQVFDEVWTLELGGSAFLPQITNFVVEVDDEEEGRM